MHQVPLSARVVQELRARLTVEEIQVVERVFRIVREVLEGSDKEAPAAHRRGQ